MKTFRHIILALTALILASCAVDEFWEGSDYTEGEEVVMTFRPKFEDFEAVTKAIGDGSQVDQLLVHVYEEGSDQFQEKTYGIKNCQVKQEVKIPFFYGKKYKVYFWAYKSGNDSPYTVSNIGLKGGVSVNYPDRELGFDALESLDAFYAVSDVDLSNGRTMDINLTRPFAQVNLVADKIELLKAQATKIEFTINVAETFNLASQKVEGTTGEQTFTFTSTDYFQTTEEINGNVYLGTTYLFVPSSGKVTGKVKLYAGDNVLKSAENIEIPLVGNKRTNLVFSGFQISVPEWDSSKETVPGASDGWIIITEPEQLAALLMTGTTEGTKVKIGQPLNMEKMPESYYEEIVGNSFNALTLNGNSLTIKNYKAPAFFANATNLTLSNLTLENVHITAATHVGVLVNELKGNGTFTNVTVKGSSATTTNGAAGGFVGRSVRTSEKDRSETLALTFTGCRIEGTDDKKIVATGSAAEGKFVGLFTGYDNGEKLVFTDCTSENAIVADFNSRYVEGNEGAWLADNNYSSYNGFLGAETYFRGKVYFGGENEATNRFCAKWDGVTTVEPLYEDASKKIAQIWSAFDLAYLQGKTMTTLRFKSNVDMCGICNECKIARSNPCSESLYLNTPGHKCASCPDELYHCDKCTYFTPIQTINNIYGEEHTIYNLNIQQEHNNGMSWGAGFCNRLNSGTIENLTFDGAYIKCTDIQSLRNNTQSGGNAYAGTLASRTNESANITIKNVHANNGYVTAVSKFGGMIGYVHGTLSASDCSVNNYTIENNKINVINTYEKSVSISNLGTFSVSAEFYTEGEAGGFIGFLTSGNSIISDCHVTNAIMKCYGQDNQTKTISGKIFGFIPVSYPYNIAGRHINAFIGDIRTVNQETITITNCTATYTSPGGYDYNINSTGKGEIIGCCYIVGVANVVGDKKGKVTVDGESMGFVGD